MKSLSRQIKEGTKHIVLSTDEKERMRESLVSYMEYKPIRSGKVLIREPKKIPVFSFFRAHHFSGALLIAMIVTSSTFGMTFAADDALPGDLLYGVKVNFNEEIKSVFLSTPEDRIAWEQERAERRLVEASQLAAEGRLDEKNQEQVSKLFAEHTNAVLEQVLATEEVDPVLAAEMSSTFEESLDTHEAVLARLIVEQEENAGENSRDLVEQVRTVAMEAGKIREDAEEKVIAEEVVSVTEETTQEPTLEQPSEEEKRESANMRIRAIERAQQRAANLLSTLQEQVASLEDGTTMKTQAEAQIAFGVEMMERGAESFEIQNYNEAYVSYRQAAATFQKVSQLLKVTQLFSVEIYPDSGSTVADEMGEYADETTSTSEEVQEEDTDITKKEAEELKVQAESVIQDVRTLLMTQGGYDEAVGAKANARIKDAGAYVLRGEISMVLGDYEKAKTLFGRAYDFAEEVMRMLTEVSDETVEVVPTDGGNTPSDTTLSLSHEFSEGVHTYSGKIEVPAPCYSLEGTAVVAESFPEQITLILTRHAPEAGSACIEVETTKTFSIAVPASEGAVLGNITVDGDSVLWTLVGKNTEEQNSGEEQESGPGLFKRAIDTTQQLFSPN